MPETITRPIIMSTPMVRQIDAGRKTRTFRLPTSMWANIKMRHDAGDRVLLWVREAWARVGNVDPGFLTYRATFPHDLPPDLENIPDRIEDAGYHWRPSIYLPECASRFTLEVERVGDLRSVTNITARGVEAEGCQFDQDGFYFGDTNDRWRTQIRAFAAFWDTLHTKPGTRWADQPRGYAISFKVHRANVDQVLRELAA